MGRQISSVGVIGLGTMGSGIAEVFARHGLTVTGVDKDDEGAAAGRARVEASTARAVQRGKISEEERQTQLGRIGYGADLAAVAGADLVIESVPESIDLKREIFCNLDRIVDDDAILATNTSSLSVTDIAVSTKLPTRVIGMHFFNPAPVQKLVEIVRTVVTTDDVVADVHALAELLNRPPVIVADRAGFIANALLLGYLNHATSMLENRYATREDIDAAMMLGCGYPMGPLALIDLIGLDTAFSVLDTMYKQGRDRLHAPSPLLKQMITAGLLGRKTGRGFYTYDKPGSSTVVPDNQTPSADAGSRPTRAIERVGVVGSGTMAVGIAEVFAKGGYATHLVSRSAGKADAAKATLAKSLEKGVQRGKLTQEKKEATLGLFTVSSDLSDLGDVDIVVEAIAEELTAKLAMFENLDEICKPGAILATTTSSLPVVRCAAGTSRPQDVIGMHFFNPAPVMKLVEVVSTVSTAPDVADTVTALCSTLGKRAVRCADRSGFIVNALLFPYLNDAVKMLEAHYATVDDIDTAMKAGCGLPMGPFELLDVVGLDVSLAIQRELYVEFRERSLSPAPLLEHLVTAGYLGRKTKRGFRTY